VQTYLVRKSPWQKQIPTFLGVGVLLIGLVVGIWFIGTGPGVFAPRATPQTTPKNVKITNVTDTTFSVSFVTDEQTAGFVKYGTKADAMTLQASDDRDQLSGQVGKYSTHHITMRNLSAGSEYFFTIGTGSNVAYDNNGTPFTVKTGARAAGSSAAKTVYGTVTAEGGTPADGAIVYVVAAGAGELSAIVKSSGSWAIPLAQARKADGSGLAQVKDTDSLAIVVVGPQSTQTAQTTTTVAQAQPVTAIVAGTGATTSQSTASEIGGSTGAPPVASPIAFAGGVLPSPSTGPLSFEPPTSSSSAIGFGGLGSALTASSSASGSATEPVNAVVDTEQSSGQVINTSQPIITGTIAPNITVRIQINSEEEIVTNVRTDANGKFTVDLEALGKDLEPGEHTIRLQYTDPTTGEQKEEVITFTVTASGVNSGSQLLAQANPSPTPFGSGNPFSATSSATKSATVSTSTLSATVSGTKGGLPKAGSVGLTVGLIGAGCFFILLGSASYVMSQWLLAHHLDDEFDVD
jgi:hypothetical protein